MVAKETERSESFLPSLRQVVAALACGLAFMEEGLSDGYTTSAFPQLLEDDTLRGVTTSSAAWIGGLLQLGRTLPPFLLVLFAHIGRRKLLLVASLLRIVGWGLIVGSQWIEMLYIGRFLVGLGSGLFLIIAPIFLSEISSASIRGRLSLLSISCFNVGIVLSYVLGLIMSWRQLGSLGLVLAFTNGSSLCVFKETPDIFVLQGRLEEARASYEWYRGTSEGNVKDQISLLEKSGGSTYRVPKMQDLRQRASYYPFLLFLAMDLLFRCSGYNVVAGFTTDFLPESVSPPLHTAVIMGVVNCAVGFAAVITVDKVGRRPLLLLFLGAASAAMFGLGFCMLFPGSTTRYFTTAALVVFFSCATIGPGAVTYLAMAESCPMQWRLWMCSFIVGSGRLACFGTVSSYHVLSKIMGLHGICFLYASALTLSALITFKWMRETRGKTLEEIHEIMRTNTPQQTNKQSENV